MRCQQVRGFLSSYLDGLATPKEVEFVEAHLRKCPDCRRELEDLGRLIEILGSAEELKVPEGFMQELDMRLLRDKVAPYQKREDRVRPSSRPRLVALIAGIALVVGILIGTLLVQK